MPATSRIPALIAGLKTIAAGSAPPGVLVLDGLEPRPEGAKEVVWVGRSDLSREQRAARATQVWRAVGRFKREQTVNVNVLFVVQADPHDDVVAARDRAYELFGLFTEALMDDPTAGGAVRECAVAEEELTPRADEKGWAVLLLATIAGSASLTPD